jgi:hypothetical protein
MAVTGDAGGRDGLGSRADLKLPPKGKATPSNDHSSPSGTRCCLKSSRGGKFHPLNRISLTGQKVDLLVKGLRRIRRFFIVLSVGILLAHALDAFRS